MTDISSSTIERYLGSPTIENFRTDFKFLLDIIICSNGEYDLQLRPGYVNVYYKGNSMAKIEPLSRTKGYTFTVHSKFELPDIIKSLKDERFSSLSFRDHDDYHVVAVSKELVHPFFQKKVMDKLSRKIEQVNYGEEIAFEQSLITDNAGRKDFIIIDRQVTGGGIDGRLDLLALERLQGNTYKFVVLEVKLGNNLELSGKVSSQLQGYLKTIRSNMDAFKECYEKNYKEKYFLGLFSHEPWDDMPEDITIDRQVDGKILVGFYSRMAQKQIKSLIEKNDYLKKSIQLFCNEIRVGEC